MGSPLYMSPEQMRSTRNVDARADIWGLGVILYELLAGRVPFEASSMPELCALILTEAPRPVSAFRPDTPPELEMALSHCLEKDPTRRFSNVSELAHAIVPFGSRIGETSALRISRILGAAGMALPPAATPGRAHNGASGASTAQSWAKTGQRTGAGKSTTWMVAGGAILVVVGAVAALLFLRSSVGTSNATETTALVAPTAPASSLVRDFPGSSALALPSPAPSPMPATAAAPATDSAAPKAAPVPARPREAPARPARETAPAPAPAPLPTKKNPLNIDLK
jgi:hypothetical protein